ncbi:MAG: LacI family DNA-binding transcriptional regulator [Phycisphaeraceae bacterium]|nr:LacI family DNA-binding transcriptional regulator [Phycisphaeraceae bacterium]
MISMKQIATICDVSVPTVSKALGNRPSVNPQTRQRILKVAEQFNYRPNALIRGIQSGRTMTVAVACNRIDDPFGAQVMQGVLGGLHQNQFECLLFNWDQSVRDGKRILQIIGERRVDGLILLPPEQIPSAEYMTELRTFHRPIVIVDQTFADQTFNFVGTDDGPGIEAIVQHLTQFGHQQIGHLYNDTVSTGQIRANALTRALAQLGLTIPQAWSRPVVGDFDDSYVQATAILSQNARPTALVCFNDHVAMGAHAAAYDLGLSVPRDLSITGFADLPEAHTMRPALTTVNQNVPQVGQRAVELLVEKIEQGEQGSQESQTIRLPVELVVRDSTAPAPGSLLENTSGFLKVDEPLSTL